MKNLVALLCLMSALLISVFSYKCYSCFSPNSTTCNETEIECLGDDCMTTSQYIDLDGNNFYSLMKGCANDTMCGDKGSLASVNVTFKFYMNCCTGNLCNTGGYDVPSEDPAPNGVRCPTSFCPGTTDECKTDKKINCTGSMIYCFDDREHVILPGGKEGKYSIKGCMNSDACNYNFDNDVGVDVVEKTYVKCYNASKSNNLQ